MTDTTTSSILMIRPSNFFFNKQTASTNAFQKSNTDLSSNEIQQRASAEFGNFVLQLRNAKINVIVFDDTLIYPTPDSIFPNNWVSFHEDGKVVLYPMFAENRRMERRQDIIHALEINHNFKISEIIDLSYFEREKKYLEGTGSMVLDRKDKIAYACISSRTDEHVLKVFCEKLGYQPITFHTFHENKNLPHLDGDLVSNNLPVYHTNVVMTLGKEFVIICSKCITPNPASREKGEKEKVISSLKNSGKEIIEISIEQMNHFAGNMLQIKNRDGKNLLVLSAQAKSSLTANQLEKIKNHTEIIVVDIPVIEQIGGGSVRCMMAEIFCPPMI